MTPFNLPLTIIKGINFGPITIYFKQQNGSPFSLTGWVVIAHARRTHLAKEVISLEPGITDETGGVAVIQWTDEQTAALMGGEYGWDLILQEPAGGRLGPFFAGKLTVKEIFTHS